MDKITQALKSLLPEEQVSEVTKAIEGMLNEQVKKLEEEFQIKLDEAYEQVAEERKNDAEVAQAGYQQAYEIIASLTHRIDVQKEEFEATLEKGFEEALEAIEKEKAKNEELEVEIYKAANQKLQEMKNLMIDKVDQFLSLQESEIYESAKRDVLNDPRILEQRIAIEKVAELISDYMGVDSIASISSSKIEEANRQIEELKGQLRLTEAKSLRLSVQNNKLSEQVREANKIVTESVKNERKSRVNSKENASGRGQRVTNERILNEFNHNVADNKNSANVINENVDDNDNALNDLLVLAGLIEQ